MGVRVAWDTSTTDQQNTEEEKQIVRDAFIREGAADLLPMLGLDD